MNESEPSAPPRLSLVAIVGFGALGLLWPLLRFAGLEELIGGFPTALVAFLGTFAVWVLATGFGGVPRPVLTLTLAGLLFGVVMISAGLVLGSGPGLDVTHRLVAELFMIGACTGFGALTGVVAEGIQRSRAR